jgi:putative FmdB family regulatory protein
MPIYEYECECGHKFELLQKLNEKPPSKCPECGTPQVKRVISAPSLKFVGTGWTEKHHK